MTATETTPLTAAPSSGHQALWMLNSLMVERATAADTAGTFSLWEQWITSEGNPPPHVHEHEHEAFLVLEGHIWVSVGGELSHLGPGDFAFAPRGVPHVYGAESEVARLLVLATPGGAEQFFRSVGTPAEAMTLPQPAAPDVPFVVSTAADNGITILAPPAA